jgi:sulfur-carrier protein
MKVTLPSPVADYTAGRRVVDAHGVSLAAMFTDLERQFPGIRFRMIDEQDAIRPHIRVFVNREPAATLAHPLAEADEVLVVAALSGG